VDERIRQYVQKVARERAPWFGSDITKVHWCTEVGFERRLVTQFGRERCWLVGDAAHQTGPAGVQSMNVGFAEANSLASALKKILRESASFELLDQHNRDWQKEWRSLLGLAGGLSPRGQPSEWISKRASRILPCLPGYGLDLAELAGQLQLAPA
jgi:2-polyprenyl-6-methoxyphenol hydroxylase-like FAD-dependent oxidoreductase